MQDLPRLAQMVIDAAAAGVVASAFADAAAGLRAPWEQNQAHVHSALGPLYAREAAATTSVYLLDDLARDAASQLSHPRRYALIKSLARLPAKRLWLEWSPKEWHGHRLAAELKENINGQIDIRLFGELGASKLLCAWSSPPDWSDKNIDVAISFPGFSTNMSPLRGLVTEIFQAANWSIQVFLAFLTVSGATVVDRRLTKEGKRQRVKTGSRGRPCLLSYNSVKLALPQGDIRRESIGFTRGPGVRWHEVRGHWRELTLGEQKVMRYIWAFHRGNARLGVVLKTRNVTAKRLKHDLPPPELAA